MANIEVKIVWFSSQNSAEAETTLAELLSAGWKITHVSGGGSESYSVDVPQDQIVPFAATQRQRALGFAILERRPPGFRHG